MSLAFDHSRRRASPSRCVQLYCAAPGARPAKFVNLDMEEYRDLDLTVAVVHGRCSTRPSSSTSTPASCCRRTSPTRTRRSTELCGVGRGGAGAAAAASRSASSRAPTSRWSSVEAEIARLAAGAVRTKAEVDAQLQAHARPRARHRVRRRGARRCAPATTCSTSRGRSCSARRSGRRHRVEIEMLEGMANRAGAAPCARPRGAAALRAGRPTRRLRRRRIAYLVRRLDENTGPENFLRAPVLAGSPGSPRVGREQRDRFLDAVARRGTRVDTTPRRTQDRTASTARFDADATVRQRARHRLRARRNRDGSNRPSPARAVATAAGRRRGRSRPEVAAPLDDRRSIRRTRTNPPTLRRGRPTWSKRRSPPRVGAARGGPAPADRRRAAPARRRGDGRRSAATRSRLMAHDTGKTMREGDPEVSEAIDFAATTRRPDSCGARRTRGPDVRVPRGTVLVASPWNFPYAIPAGRRARRPRRRQCGHPQAGAGERADGASSSPSSAGKPACLAISSSSFPAVTTRSGAASSPTTGRRRGPHRRLRHGADVPGLEAVDAAPRRDERQERHRHHRGGRYRSRGA